MRFYSFAPRILQFFAAWFSYLFFRTLYGFQARGEENLKGLKQAIFACNHASELDAIVLTAAVIHLRRFAPMFYVSRSKDFYQDAHFGWRRYVYGETFFALWGAFTAYSGLKDYEKSLRNHIKVLEDGYSLCIFPEGRMTRDGNLQEARGGVAFLSHRTGVPIVPVHIKGTYRFSFTPLPRRVRGVSIVFGEPIHPSSSGDLSPEEAKREAQAVMSRIAAL